ncbi:hypothetical protein ACPCIR_02980 [Mycobacterium sp. NPDC051198]
MTVDDIALAIDAAQLVSLGDTAAALELLRGAEHHAELQHAALSILAYVLGGDGAPERFAELRSQVHHLALQRGAQNRQVVLNLEVVAAAEALAQGDPDRADVIVAGSEFAGIDVAWCATCLLGQCVCGWLGTDRLAEFWGDLRCHYGIRGA